MIVLIDKLKRIVKAKLLNQDRWVLGRIACMGQDVFKLLDTGLPLWNIQKGRVDYLLSVIERRERRARPEDVVGYLTRPDIGPLLIEEWATQWLSFRPPSLILMDSYSELTDQLFVHRRADWRFCCNYLDIDHDLLPGEDFSCEGLLAEESLEGHYTAWFTELRRRFGPVPIVFLHFPTKLDRRRKFQQRHRSIVGVIERMALRFPPLHSIDLDPSIVDVPEQPAEGLEDFPYHYNQRTYEELASQVRALKLLPE